MTTVTIVLVLTCVTLAAAATIVSYAVSEACHTAREWKRMDGDLKLELFERRVALVRGRAEDEEDKPDLFDPDLDRFREWLMDNVEPGPRRDDFIGMYEVVRGTREAARDRVLECQRRLIEAGAPLPGM